MKDNTDDLAQNYSNFMLTHWGYRSIALNNRNIR